MTTAQWTGVAFIEARASDDGQADDGAQVSVVQLIWEVADEGTAAYLREQLTALLGDPESEILLDDPSTRALVDAVDGCGSVRLRP